VGGCIDPPFLTLVLDRNEWSGSRAGRFTPGERAPGTHWIGDWVGLRTGQNEVERKKNLAPIGIGTPTVMMMMMHFFQYDSTLILKLANLFLEKKDAGNDNKNHNNDSNKSNMMV
jgi:hypothetical protein